MKINATISTNGLGYWTRSVRSLKITSLEVPYVNEEYTFAELRAYFDPTDWDIHKEGLVYTDKQALKEFREYLVGIGLDGSDVEYSEQGMQEYNYISYDVGGDFLKSWDKLMVVV